MDKESLILAKEIITKGLDESSEINIVDKVELMLNLDKFLNEKEYEENIQTLKVKQKTLRR